MESKPSPATGESFRKKPVVIQAVQWWPSIERGHFEDDGKYVCRSVGCDALGVEYTVCDVGLRTMEGFMHIKPGYWIITGVKGERYACEPSIFEMTYEPASAASETPRSFSDFIRNATPEEKEKVYAEVMQKATERQNAVSAIAPSTAPDEDGERYRWFRDECELEQQADIVEVAEGSAHMLDHHIDKGRCGL